MLKISFILTNYTILFEANVTADFFIHYIREINQRQGGESIIPKPAARSAVLGVSPGQGLLILLSYLHPGKCEPSEVQSHLLDV